MKIEIKKEKNTTFLYINGVRYGKHISGYQIKQDGVSNPQLILYIDCNELTFECDDCEVKQINLKDSHN